MSYKLLTALLCHLLFVDSAYAQRIVFTPQWTVQSQFAGYYVAQEKGFYQECGLEVVIEHPSASNAALNRLIEGKSQVITLQLIQAMRAVDNGLPLINIMQTSQNNSLMLVSRHKVNSLPELKGKKIGKWIAGFGELGEVLNKQKKLDFEWIPFINNVNLFVSGAIDATLAMSYNEYFQILSSGIKLHPTGIFKFSEMGFNIPEDGLYVTSDFYKTHKIPLDRFAAASRKGWEWAAEHPKEALEIVMKWVKQARIATNRTHQMWMLNEVLKLQLDPDSGKASFTLHPEKVNEAGKLLLEYQIIKNPVTFRQITEGQ